ncbi:hypothetical protein ACQY0O_000207 [Thecaphora frezii]
MTNLQGDSLLDSLAEGRRPSVARATSLPSSSSSSSSNPALFASCGTDGYNRPPLPRACSESVAAGVLERRRRKALSENGSAPLSLVLDFGGISSKVGLADFSLMKAARRAAIEPREWDWGFGQTSSDVGIRSSKSAGAEASTFSLTGVKARRVGTYFAGSHEDDAFVVGQSESSRDAGAYLYEPATAIESARYAFDCEWDWALSGRCRVSPELYCGSSSRRAAKAYLPRDDVDEWSRRSRLPVAGELDGDGRLNHHQAARHASDQLVQQEANDHLRSRSRQRAAKVQSQHPHHRHKASLQISTVLPLAIAIHEEADEGQSPATPSSAKVWSPFEGAREHALGSARSRSVERCRSIV